MCRATKIFTIPLFLAAFAFAAPCAGAAEEVQPLKLRTVPFLLPDLVVDDLRLTPSCLLEAKIRNKGKGNVGDDLLGKVLVLAKVGDRAESFPLTALEGCGSVGSTGSGAWCGTRVTIVGRKRVKVTVDPGGAVPEEDEKNNHRWEELTCAKKSAAPGVSTKEKVAVPPQAPEKPPAPRVGKAVPLKPPEVKKPALQPSPLPPAMKKKSEPSGNSEPSFGTAIVAPMKMARFRNDPPQAGAVLSFFGASVSPPVPPQGGTATVSFTIKNTGGSPSPGPTSFALDVYSSDATGMPAPGDFVHVIPWYTNNIPVLVPGQSHTISAPVTLAHGGPHTANGVIITEGYTLEEVSTFKSPSKHSFQVVFLPDLVVCFKKNNHFSSAQQVSLPPKVKNFGGAASTPVNLSFWIEGKGTENYTIPVIAPGGEYLGVQRTLWMGSGARFSLTVDSSGVLTEVHENNNIIEGYISVGQYGSNSQTLCSDQPGMTGW